MTVVEKSSHYSECWENIDYGGYKLRRSVTLGNEIHWYIREGLVSVDHTLKVEDLETEYQKINPKIETAKEVFSRKLYGKTFAVDRYHDMIRNLCHEAMREFAIQHRKLILEKVSNVAIKVGIGRQLYTAEEVRKLIDDCYPEDNIK